jgi:hypothetical protein
MAKVRADRPWKGTGEATALLNVSSDWLYAMLPYWKAGRHYRDIRRPTASLPRYQWHIPHVEEWLEQDASRRG